MTYHTPKGASFWNVITMLLRSGCYFGLGLKPIVRFLRNLKSIIGEYSVRGTGLDRGLRQEARMGR